MVGFNSIPKVAVVPILVIVVWNRYSARCAHGFFDFFFPIVVNVATGLATTEPELEDVMRSGKPASLILC